MEGLIVKSKQLLHPQNIYYCRLQTAYLQVCGNARALLDPDMQQRIYENYKR